MGPEFQKVYKIITTRSLQKFVLLGALVIYFINRSPQNSENLQRRATEFGKQACRIWKNLSWKTVIP